MSRSDKLFGIAALFDSPNSIIHAADAVVEAGYKKFDAHTPYPLHGLDKAMRLKPSKLGFVTLSFGLSGTAFILFFMWWAMSVDYPMVVGGKPFFALPAFIPITFEFTVLLAALSTVFGMIAAFLYLPNNSHPLHDTEYMKKVSSDRYGIVIEADDPNFNEAEINTLFKNLHAVHIEPVYQRVKEVHPIFQPKFLMFLAVVALFSCGGTYLMLNKLMYVPPFTWMAEQDKVKPQEESFLFSDDFAMRKPVNGTVARGFIPYPYMGQPEPTVPLSNPLLPTKDVLALGKKKFQTFCSPCHGNLANGNSRLRGQFPKPPSLHTERALNFSDGKIYHIITNGQNIMPSYADQISRKERWAIINYVRVLQRAENAKESDITEIKKESGKNAQ